MPQDRFPSARDGLSGRQRLVLLLFLGFIASASFLTTHPIAAIALLFSPLFLVFIIILLGSSIDALMLPEKAAVSQSRRMPDRAQWPSYTLLVPLLDEEAIIPQLCLALKNLAYPPDRLEVIFLLEADDLRTREALEKHANAPWMWRLVVPEGQPRTKPRALNHGLAHANGQYVVVYDAEDIPDPDQLWLAVLQFEALPADVFCLQAHLRIENPQASWFSKMMCLEYAGLFEVIKPGLARARLPVALGGTSNHFRRSMLLSLGSWDAYNVTEDADMGFRIARGGGIVVDLASTTREEAPVTLKGWLGQRRRWLKGWIQTGISHSREPGRALAEMGLEDWIVAMSQILGVVIGTILFPIFCASFFWNVWHGTFFEGSTWLDFVTNSVAVVIFLGGVCAMVAPTIIGLSRLGCLHLAPWLLTLPIYALLVFLAACLAIKDIVLRPFHWIKTSHGSGGTLKNKPTRR